MAMEAPLSLSSSLGVLRHSLRATVCCFVGGSGGLAERVRWRRRTGARDFRYNPLSSYVLNFDDGNHGVNGDEGHRCLDAFLLSPQLTRRPGAAVEAMYVAAAPGDE